MDCNHHVETGTVRARWRRWRHQLERAASLRSRRSMLAIVTSGLLLAGIITLQAARAQAPQVARVTAERFAFTPSEITVAPGTEIEFHLTSEDTAHGFHILGQGVDLTIPKRGRGEATVRFAPPSPGRYVFECSRMCGAGHSFMRGTVIVKARTETTR
jgi:cytochrome c oxidase subunit 2